MFPTILLQKVFLTQKRTQHLFTDRINESTAVPGYLNKVQSYICLLFSSEISVISHEKVKTGSSCTGEDKQDC